MIPTAPARPCPACGAMVPGSMADHGVEQHGVVRPQIVVAVAGLLAVAAGLCTFQALIGLKDLTDVFGFGEFERLFTMLFLLIFLVMGAYGVALGLIVRMVWRGDRAGRVLAFAACGPVALFAFAGGDGEIGYVLVGLAAVGVLGILAFVPDATAWFTGPFAARHDEPSTIVASRALLGWSGFLAGVGAATYFVVATVDSEKWIPFLAYAGGAALLLTSVGGLASGDPNLRIRASAGAGLVVLAAILADSMDVGSLATLGPAIAAVGLLWLGEEVTAHFSGSPAAGSHFGAAARPAPSTSSEWGAPDPQPDPLAAPGTDWAAPPPDAHPFAAPRSSPPDADPFAVAPPAGGGLGDLPRPDPFERVDRPSPYAAPPVTRAPFAPPIPAPVPTPVLAPAAPVTASLPAAVSARVGSVGFTSVSGPRVVFLLQMAGARWVSGDAATAWLEAARASIVVLAGDVTRILVEAPEEASERVVDVVQRSLQRDDPQLRLEPSHAATPSPGPMGVTAPPAGWYADPYVQGGIREWDGVGWTGSAAR